MKLTAHVHKIVSIVVLTICVGIVAGAWYLISVENRVEHADPPEITDTNSAIEVTDFDSCVAAGNPVMESYPEQCSANGQTFLNETDPDDYTIDSSVWRIYEPANKAYSIAIPNGWRVVVDSKNDRQFMVYEVAGLDDTAQAEVVVADEPTNLQASPGLSFSYATRIFDYQLDYTESYEYQTAAGVDIRKYISTLENGNKHIHYITRDELISIEYIFNSSTGNHTQLVEAMIDTLQTP